MSASSQRSLPEVLQDIVANLQEIIRSEIRLATTEIKEQAARAANPAATLGAGLVLGFYAAGFLLLTIVYALTLVVAPWLAALIVSLLVGLPALFLISSGRARLRAIETKPEKTIESMKENVQWAKNQMK